MVKKPLLEDRAVREAPVVDTREPEREPRLRLQVESLEDRLAPEGEYPPIWPF
jgi:hypothetical protein